MDTAPLIPKHPDRALSERAGHVVRAVPKMCWWNARNVARLGRPWPSNARKWLAGAEYVEGWCVDSAIPLIFEHAWVELPDGTIIEPTLCRKALYFDGMTEFNPTHYTYFPVVRLDCDDLPDEGNLPWHVCMFHLEHSFYAEWMDAYDQAHTFTWGQSWRATFDAMAAAQKQQAGSTATTISVRQPGSSVSVGAPLIPAQA